jgi:hypothetical protein
MNCTGLVCCGPTHPHTHTLGTEYFNWHAYSCLMATRWAASARRWSARPPAGSTTTCATTTGACARARALVSARVFGHVSGAPALRGPARGSNACGVVLLCRASSAPLRDLIHAPTALAACCGL